MAFVVLSLLVPNFWVSLIFSTFDKLFPLILIWIGGSLLVSLFTNATPDEG
jgi:hypothetical protein